MNPQEKDDIKNTVDAEQNDAQGGAPNQMNSGGASGNYSGHTGGNGQPAPKTPRGPNIFNILFDRISSLFNQHIFADRVSKSAQTIDTANSLSWWKAEMWIRPC